MNTQHFAFEESHTHKGLQNSSGENNCFLNVTIQALWHLGPFRANLKQLMAAVTEGQFSSQSVNQSFILALCNLFVQYEFAEEQVLPPDELRHLLSSLNEKFEVGKIADANEALDAILQRIHTEFSFLCPSRCKCLAHQTFGVQMLEQYVCGLCGATNEPQVSDNFLLYFQSIEVLSQAAKVNQVQLLAIASGKNSEITKHGNLPERHRFLPIGQMLNFATLQFQKKLLPILSTPSLVTQQNLLIQRLKNRLFGLILRQCMVSLGQQSCPSIDENIHSGRFKCGGKARPRFNCLETPLSLALSFGWTDSRENTEIIHSFMSLIPSSVYLSDIFSSEESTEKESLLPQAYRSHGNDSALLAYLTSREQSSNLDYDELEKHLSVVPNSPSYALRGMVCYYGLHYVSIFLDNQEDNVFLLFDDQRVRPIGNWADVIQLCVRSLYQPVLLLYELEESAASACTTSSIKGQDFVVNYTQILRDLGSEQKQKNLDEPIVIDSPSSNNKFNDDVNHGIAISFPSSVNTVDVIYEQTAELHKTESDFYSSTTSSGVTIPSSILASQAKALKDNAHQSKVNGYAKLGSSSKDGKEEKDSYNDEKNKVTVSQNPLVLTAESKSNKINDYNNYDMALDESIADIRRRYNLPGVLPAYRHNGSKLENDTIQSRWNPSYSLASRPSILHSQTAAFEQRKHSLSRASVSGMSNASPIITSWGEKPLRYTCHVPVYDIRGQVFLGLQISVNTVTKLLVVTTFAAHPLTHRPTWIEKQGRVQLMDQLISLNGLPLRGVGVDEFARLLKAEMLVATKGDQSKDNLPYPVINYENSTVEDAAMQEEHDVAAKVRIEFQSEYLQVKYFVCPECSEKVTLDDAQTSLLAQQFPSSVKSSSHQHHRHSASLYLDLQCSSCRRTVRAVDFPSS